MVGFTKPSEKNRLKKWGEIFPPQFLGVKIPPKYLNKLPSPSFDWRLLGGCFDVLFLVGLDGEMASKPYFSQIIERLGQNTNFWKTTPRRCSEKYTRCFAIRMAVIFNLSMSSMNCCKPQIKDKPPNRVFWKTWGVRFPFHSSLSASLMAGKGRPKYHTSKPRTIRVFRGPNSLS